MRKTGLIITLFVLIISAAWSEDRLIEIRATKFSYTPNIVRINRGESITIRLISEDVTHGFYLDGYGLRMAAHPGTDSSVTFVADKGGRYNFRCSVTCGEFHPFMVGYLVVRPNNRFFIYVIIIGAIGIASATVMLIGKKKV